jgi:galactitol-specific phosphotransferase system IIC component
LIIEDDVDRLFIHLIDGVVGAYFGACAAVGALVLVDHILGISFGNAFNRAFRSAVAASIAFVGYDIRHVRILTKKTL